MMYQYIAADTEWLTVAVMQEEKKFVSTFDQDGVMRLRPKLIVEMEQWCDATFNADERTVGVSKLTPAEKTWGYGSGDFYFRHESDAVLFVLRWSGETAA